MLDICHPIIQLKLHVCLENEVVKSAAKGMKLGFQGLPWLRICCSQHFSQMEKVGAK